MTLVVVAIAWLAAMAAVGVWDAPWWMGAAWAAALSPLLARWREAGWVTALACIAAALVAGVLFARWHDTGPPALDPYVGRQVTLEGTIASEPDPGRTVTRYRLDVDRVDDKPMDGAVLVSLNQYAEHLPGERLRVTGELQTAPVFDGFDYRAYLARQGIAGTMLFPTVERLAPAPRWSVPRLSAETRLALERSLQHVLPEPEASLAAGIAFGRDANLPDHLAEDFRESGLAHLTAVSGANVTIVAGVVFYLFTPAVGRRRALPFAAAAILLYLLAAGLSWSVLRAGVMAGVFLLGVAIGRPQASLPALGLAAVVLTLVQPSAAADVGFQLSLAATAGIIVFAPWLRAWLDRGLVRAHVGSAAPAWLVQVTAMSVAATVATFPLQFVVFERVSLVGIVANIVVEPVFALAMVLSGLVAVLAWAWEPAGWATGLAAYYPLAFIAWTASAFASVPGASLDTPDAGAQTAMFAYAGLGAAGWFAYRTLAPATHDRRREPGARAIRRLLVAGAAGGTALALVPIALLPARGPGDLEVAFLDVGQGDAILVTTPHGHQVLVDGGPSGIETARELSALMPHWDRSLEAVVLTHPQEDHIGGLPAVMHRYDVSTVYATGAENRTQTFGVLQALARATMLAAGDSLELDGVRFDVLWPPASYETNQLNNTSIVLLLTYREVSVLLTGDIEDGAQRELLASRPLTANVLKVPHHGSKTSDSAFLQQLEAAVAVISSGAGNPFGHPHQETLDALAATHVYRTDLHGRVVVSTDGHHLKIRTER